jgi:hypothetical protein
VRLPSSHSSIQLRLISAATLRLAEVPLRPAVVPLAGETALPKSWMKSQPSSVPQMRASRFRVEEIR